MLRWTFFVLLLEISSIGAGLQYCRHQKDLVTRLVLSQDDKDGHDTEHDLIGVSSFNYQLQLQDLFFKKIKAVEKATTTG